MKHEELMNEIKRAYTNYCLRKTKTIDFDSFCAGYCCGMDRAGKKEENYTIEQNCGENRVEGGVLSVSGSVSEKKYRPFNNCDELKECYKSLYKKKTGLVPIDVGLDVPYIWVKEKGYGISQLITGFGDTVVKFSPDYTITLKSLFENYEFLDSSPCGCLEE